MPTGKVERHIVSNSQQDLVVIWWKDTQDAGWQWSSMADGGIHNLIVFRLSGYEHKFLPMRIIKKLCVPNEPQSPHMA